MNAPVLDGAEHDRRGAFRCLTVGEVEQRVGIQPLDALRDDVHAVNRLHVGLDVDGGRRLGLLLPDALELHPQQIELVERPWRYAYASPDVTASILLTPEATESSERITNGPISAVRATCVPPHSSME